MRGNLLWKMALVATLVALATVPIRADDDDDDDDRGRRGRTNGAIRIDSIRYANQFGMPTTEDRLRIEGAGFPADPVVTFGGGEVVVLEASEDTITVTGGGLGDNLPPGAYRVEVRGRRQASGASADFNIDHWRAAPGTIGPLTARATNGGPVGTIINGALRVLGTATIDFVAAKTVFAGPTDSPQAAALSVNGNGQVSGDFLVCGTLAAGAVVSANCQGPSDRRLKKDIRPLDGALAKVLALRGVTYDWRRDEFPERRLPAGRQVGFIAQEVEAVVPEVVGEVDGLKTLAPQHLTALLVEAVREQQATIERQRAEIDALAARLEALEAALAAPAGGPKVAGAAR